MRPKTGMDIPGHNGEGAKEGVVSKEWEDWDKEMAIRAHWNRRRGARAAKCSTYDRGPTRRTISQTAPLICTFRYFSSSTDASGAPAGLQSSTFSMSGLFGFWKKPARCSVRNSRAAANVSNASSFWMNESWTVRYLR